MKEKLTYVLQAAFSLILIWMAYAGAGMAMQGERVVPTAKFWGTFGFFVIVPAIFIAVGIYWSFKKKKPGVGLIITASPVLLLILSVVYAVVRS